MNQILILTRNVLSEQIFQQKLQALNYEVYCSTRLLEHYRNQLNQLDFLRFFQYIILSETLCESEVMEIIPLIKNQSIRIIRKVETQVTEMDHKYLEEEHLNAIISTDDSVDGLRECLDKLKKEMDGQENARNGEAILRLSEKVTLLRANPLYEMPLLPDDNYKLMDVLHGLSQTESRILFILIQEGNKIVSREHLCQQIWNDAANKSHMASLSNTVSRIKSKFEAKSFTSNAIQTLWGKGYRINPKLLDQIQKSDAMDVLTQTE